MNPPSTSSNWFAWLRNVVILGALGAVAFWSVGDWFVPPVPKADLGVADAKIKDIQRVARAVDADFEKEWTQHGLRPVGRADDLTIARRLSLALTGSIPSLQEIRTLESTSRADTPQWWLSQLLADRRSSDYLAERLARIYVGIENGNLVLFRRRRLVEWLGDALHQNRPYDQIVRELIDCEGVWTTNPAVNFITATHEDKKGPDEAKLAAKVSRAFLGVRIDCVQCHDGKLGSPWKQTDFHQLAAYFGQMKFNINGLRDNPKQAYKVRYLGELEEVKVPAKVPWKRELLPAKGTPRERLAAWVTAKENKAFARAIVNRMWAMLFNRPLVSPVDEVPLEGPFPPGMEVLADDFMAHGCDLQRLMRVIVATRVFQQSSRSVDPDHPATQAAEDHWAVFPVTRLRPEQMAGSVIQASSLTTIDAETHVVFRLKRAADVSNFVKRYGDSGEDTFDDGAGTIPQRLLLMNGSMINNNISNNPIINASTRIGLLAPNAAAAVEAAYLSIFTRRPTEEEAELFQGQVASSKRSKSNAMADIYWTLMNATEFSWNH